ncbi:MAG TPA: tetratricopeptide repeat protein, partial [Blastocatellia bacterium]|nr:tetratricopeptide repeat protein [Blastocatellia bacterium]
MLTEHYTLNRPESQVPPPLPVTAERPEPISVHLDLKEKLADRQAECHAILNELRSDGGRRILPIVAPAGFGKTSLVIKVLQQVSDGEKFLDSEMGALLTLDCREGPLTLGRLFEKAGRLQGQGYYFRRIHADRNRPLRARIQELIDRLTAPGRVWIVLDNFEALLEGHSIRDDEIRQFIEEGSTSDSRFRLILVTRRLPELPDPGRSGPLPIVTAGLIAGLPEAEAVAYLKSGGADCGLSEKAEAESWLRACARRVRFIPIALKSVTGYLRRCYPTLTLKDLMNDPRYLAGFDRGNDREGLNRILEAQLSLLTPKERMLLIILALFAGPVPQAALDYVAPKDELAQILNALILDYLIEIRTDRFGIRSYTLHPIVREHRLLRTWRETMRIGSEFADFCWENAVRSYHRALFSLSAILSDCAITIYRRLLAHPGRPELSADLAAASINKGAALRSLGQWSEALHCYEEAVRICQVNSAHDEHLARALSGQGHALRRLGQWEQALGSYQKAAEIYQCAVDSGRSRLNSDLARTLMNQGGALTSLGRQAEALDCYERAARLRKGLPGSDRGEPAPELARALIDHGDVLRSVGERSRARARYGEAIEIYRTLIDSGHQELVGDLARALINQGVALEALGRQSQALGCYEEADRIRSEPADSRLAQYAGDLAMALMHEGAAFESCGQPDEALDCYQRAIEILKGEVDAGCDDLADDLAMGLINTGVVLDSLGRRSQALPCYEEAVEIRTRLVNSGRRDLANDLARALMNKGVALNSLGQISEAIDCYERAIEIRRQLVSSGRRDLAPDLARALMNKGVAHDSRGEAEEALNCYRQAAGIHRRLIGSDRDQPGKELARALINQGVVLRSLGRLDESLNCYEEAIQIRGRLVDSGHHDLANDLARALMNKGNALASLGRIGEAQACYERAIEIRRGLVNSGRGDLADDLVR